MIMIIFCSTVSLVNFYCGSFLDTVVIKRPDVFCHCSLLWIVHSNFYNVDVKIDTLLRFVDEQCLQFRPLAH